VTFIQGIGVLLLRFWAAATVVQNVAILVNAGFALSSARRRSIAENAAESGSASRLLTTIYDAGFFLLLGAVVWIFAPFLARAAAPKGVVGGEIAPDTDALLAASTVLAGAWMFLTAFPELVANFIFHVRHVLDEDATAYVSLPSVWLADLITALIAAFIVLRPSVIVRMLSWIRNAHSPAYRRPDDDDED